MKILLLKFIFFSFLTWNSLAEVIPSPAFVGPVANVTVPLGREGVITCTVDNLGSYKVAWVRIETQTILTIHTHVITRSNRISLSHTDSWTWSLVIKNVRESDRGWYMCQINTDPMMSQNGYLQVVVPPDIDSEMTSSDMVVREGANVTLQCVATGFPPPRITWRREDKAKIMIEDQALDYKDGPFLNFTKANRLHMGVYLCIASNYIPPTVSKRISLIVHFAPMITIAHQLVGAAIGQDVILECHSEAFPKSINYWRRDTGETIVHGSKDSTIEAEKYEPYLLDNVYKITMRLTIRSVSLSDYGSYVCLSKNSLGETDGLIKLYPITQTPSILTAKTTILPSSNSNQNFSSTKGNNNRRSQHFRNSHNGGNSTLNLHKTKGYRENIHSIKKSVEESQNSSKSSKLIELTILSNVELIFAYLIIKLGYN